LASFRPLSDSELQRLTDDQLIDYIRKARASGKLAEVDQALAILAWGYMGTIRHRVSLRIPDQDLEEVAWDVLEGALKSAFDGDSTIEFRGWIRIIIRNKVADYWRKREGDPKQVPLPEEHEGNEDVWGVTPAVEGKSPELIDLEAAIDRGYDELERDDHRRVIDEAIFADRPSAEVAAEIPGMTAANVDQIKSRFRKSVRELLEGHGDTSS
jgi:DNA-directed RNA polymerase specialized sigma24 family protein